MNGFAEEFEDYDAHADDTFSIQKFYLESKIWSIVRGNYRKLIEVFCTGSKNSNAKLINKLPEETHVPQWAPIIQDQGTSDGETAHKKIPHHPPSSPWIKIC